MSDCFNNAIQTLVTDGLLRVTVDGRYFRADSVLGRTCEIIESGGLILLKRGEQYIQQHSQVAGGEDSLIWGNREAALHFNDLELAFILAPYFDCKVVSYYPKGKKR